MYSCIHKTVANFTNQNTRYFRERLQIDCLPVEVIKMKETYENLLEKNKRQAS